jgi:class 3 adenylate cyclase
MARLQHKSLDRPDEVRAYPLGRTEVFALDDAVIGRMTMEPGWRWSEHVRPLVETDRCMNHHLGVVLSGRLHISLEDGTSMEFGPQEAFEIPPGHDAWVVGEEPWVAIDVAGARSYARSRIESGETVLATVAFADIVDSTAILEGMGDAAWRELLSEFYARMEAQLDRFGGRQVDRAGDGLLAVFDGAGRAVQCAAGMVRSARQMDLVLRAGVHTGDVERVRGGLRGVAVHAAARIAALAGPGEVLVSDTTYQLAAGSRVPFESRGMTTLRGLAGERELFALVDP